MGRDKRRRSQSPDSHRSRSPVSGGSRRHGDPHRARDYSLKREYDYSERRRREERGKRRDVRDYRSREKEDYYSSRRDDDKSYSSRRKDYNSQERGDSYSRRRDELDSRASARGKEDLQKFRGKMSESLSAAADGNSVDDNSKLPGNSEDLQSLPEDEMMSLLGLPSSFGSSKNQKRGESESLSGAKVKSNRKYRVYMNRQGGNERPLMDHP